MVILGVDGLGLVRIGVHGGHTRVVLLRHKVAVLGKACRPLEHVHAGMRLLLLGLLVVVDWRLAIRDTVVLVRAAG